MRSIAIVVMLLGFVGSAVAQDDRQADQCGWLQHVYNSMPRPEGIEPVQRRMLDGSTRLYYPITAEAAAVQEQMDELGCSAKE